MCLDRGATLENYASMQMLELNIIPISYSEIYKSLRASQYSIGETENQTGAPVNTDLTWSVPKHPRCLKRFMG